MIRLSTIEQKILSVVELDARASVDYLQKVTKLRPHSIRYALKQLRDKNIIVPQIWINPSQLGLMHVFCFFSVKFPEANSRQDLELFISQSSQVYWLAEIAGEYQFELGLVVKNTNEALEFLQLISSKLKILILKKELFFRTNMTLYSRTYLHKQDRKVLTTSVDHSFNSPVDETDFNILQKLSRDPLLSNRDIALALNLSPATINNRVNHLMNQGIIGGFWYLVNSEEIQNKMYYLQIYTRGFERRIAAQLHKFALQFPAIIFLHQGLGAWDFQIHAETNSGEELAALVEALHQKFYNEIGSIRVFTRLKILKCSMLG